MIIFTDDFIEHYGTPRHSGRYPWGSGDNAQRSKDFLSYVTELRKQGLSEVEIAKGLEITTTELRAQKALAKNAATAADIAMAQRLKDKGMSNVEIGKQMGKPESTVRSLLKPGAEDKNNILIATSNSLKEQVAEKTYIDIGKGVEHHLGVSNDKLSNAVAMLKEEGYTVHYVKVTQLGTGLETSTKVLAPPNTPYSEVYKNRDNIKLPFQHSEDGGRSFVSLQPPLSISSKRVGIRYAEDGGTDADGVVYVRPGVKDCSLGKASYAQVRVAVDNTHYIKGMAVYKDDLPPGIDLMFNTNKSNTGNKLDALKPMKDDPENPFGSSISRQLLGFDKDGKVHVKSAMNIVNEEGDWDKWSNALSTQMLSKQNPSLAKKQLDITYQNRKAEYDQIKQLTNPAVKKKLLESFADNTDSAAVQLKAAAFPGQRNHVILPVPKMNEKEIYAPNYNNGDRVVLVRHPHGGLFEIPELTVNNRQPDAKKLLGNAVDAVGINPKVAQKLSGADFDGDHVLVIPNNNSQVKSRPSLEGLKNFDPQKAYPYYEGMKVMNPHYKQTQMGEISNLISDMTIKGANFDEIARAVRHSMVVIDSEKHKLNYKQSYIDNGIPALKAKYQSGGASTLVSRASSNVRVPKRKPRSAGQGGPIDPKTGKKVWVETNESYVNAKGQTIYRTQNSTRLAETHDAHTLSSGTPIERIYADHSNRLKAMANDARKEMLGTPSQKYSPSAKKAYHNEVTSLNAKLRLAQRNAPLERQAQILANAGVKARLKANPNLDADQIKKIKTQEQTKARLRVQAKKPLVELTEKEWQAIQAGAISNAQLMDILRYADQNKIKEFATPRKVSILSTSDRARAKVMLDKGYTQADVAKQLGVSLTTLKTVLNGEG